MYVSTGIVTNSGRASALVIGNLNLVIVNLNLVIVNLVFCVVNWTYVKVFFVFLINVAFLGSERH